MISPGIDPVGALIAPEGMDPTALDGDFAPMLAELEAEEPADDFYRNLAEDLGDEALSSLASKVIREERIDRESRQEWDDQLAKGLQQLGFDRSRDQRSDPFPGASAVTHPLLAQSIVDIHARLMKEMLPAKGPVDTQIIGQETPQKRDRATRIKDHMNYQLTIEVPEYRDETDSMFMLLGAAGSCFKLIYWDMGAKRLRVEFILPDDFVVPYGAKSLENAPRYTRRLHMFDGEASAMQRSGAWLDIPLGSPSGDDDISRVREVSDRIQGEDKPGESEYDQHLFLEQHRDCDEPELVGMDDAPEGMALPYIVTVHVGTGKVVAIRRNWKQPVEDAAPDYRKRVWFIHYKFLPWMGFYGIGLLHLIGGLGIAATGALRAMMDAAAIRNAPGGLRLRGSRVNGTTLTYSPLEFTEVDAPGVRKIQDIAMPYPQNPSDPAMFQLLGFLTQEGAKFASVTTQAIQDGTNNGPVGTTLALIEQGSMVYSDIHARQHYSAGKEFQLIADLNHEHLDDEVNFRVFGGENVISWQDYSGEVNVVPVSDPSIFSQAQRAARAQAELQLAEKASQMGVPVNLPLAFRNVAETLNLPDTDELFPEPQQAQPLDPVSEVQALKDGMPVKAFPGQAHDAHVQFLMSVAQDPKYQMLMPMIGPRLQALVADHLVLGMQADMALAMQQSGMMPQDPNQLAMIVAQIEQEQAQQRMQAAQQGQAPQQDPGLIQVAAADVQRKAQADAAKAAEESRRTDMDAMRAAAEIASKERLDAAKSASALELELIRQAGETERQRMKDEAQTHREHAEDMRDIALGQAGAEVKVST